MITAEHISFSYEENGPQILRDINIEIPAGQWLAIIGANGSGKSTLARHLNGLLLPQQGCVLVDGLDTANDDELWQARQKVAFVFQNPDNQLVATSVEDDVAFGPENLGLPPQEIARRVTEALDIIGLADKRHKAPHLLSGGEKQRVAIAGALAMRSAYMVLDEPTSMLDPQLRLSVIRTLQQLHQKLGMGIVYVTNIMEEALLAQRVIVLQQGRLVKDGNPAEIFSDHQWLLERQLALPPVCHIASLLATDGYKELAGCLSMEELLARMASFRCVARSSVGGACVVAQNEQPIVEADTHSARTLCVPTKKPATQETYTAPIISVSGLTYTYQPGSVHAAQALGGLDLTIRRGEMVALIGHSGSGKSTLAQILTGLLAPGDGELTVNGVAAADLPRGGIFPGVGLVFQYPEQQLFAETVFEEVAFAPKNMGVSEGELPELVQKALVDVGLNPQHFEKRSPFALSGGQKRRLCLAGVLAMGAEILILDEPTAGLDEGGKRWIMELVCRLHKQGKTVIWISHNMEEVAELAQRIIVLSQGRLLHDGSPAEVFAAERQLADLGLDIPVAAKLVRRAKESGLELPGAAITVDEAYREFSAWLGGGRHS